MDISRERINWAFACKACMCYMTGGEVLSICDKNKDIFTVGKGVIFTKEFLDEAAKVDSMSEVWRCNRGL